MEVGYLVGWIAMLKFRPMHEHPNRFVPVLIQRDLNSHLEINGVVHYGLTERRSEFVISYFSGRHFIGREAHWSAWAEIPSESLWNPANVFLPGPLEPVLIILPQPVVLKSLTLSAGLNFGYFDNRKDKTWRIYYRNPGARITKSVESCWISIGMKQISSWLQLPQVILDEKLRAT